MSLKSNLQLQCFVVTSIVDFATMAKIAKKSAPKTATRKVKRRGVEYRFRLPLC